MTGLSRYWGLLGARNCELIQPFKPVFSTWTQSPPAHARGISLSSGVGDNFLMADGGVTPMDDTFTFELGGFLTGFTPDQSNFSLWESNWVVFDSAVYLDGWNPDFGISNYASTANAIAVVGNSSLITSSDTTNQFTVGQRAYIWTYNSKTISPTAQWSLITNTAWNYPVARSADPNPLEWTLADAGNMAIAGATSTDGGTFVSTLQTQAVPEPGSALLILVAGVMNLSAFVAGMVVEGRGRRKVSVAERATGVW